MKAYLAVSALLMVRMYPGSCAHRINTMATDVTKGSEAL